MGKGIKIAYFNSHVKNITKHNTNRNPYEVIAGYVDIRYNALPASSNSNSCT